MSNQLFFPIVSNFLIIFCFFPFFLWVSRDNFTVSLVTGVDTTLADLLALDLHRYEDEVRSVVDRAVREVSMEKTLRELEATWATLELGKEEHARTGLTLLKASDELIATLEDNQVKSNHLIHFKIFSKCGRNFEMGWMMMAGPIANAGQFQVRCPFDDGCFRLAATFRACGSSAGLVV